MFESIRNSPTSEVPLDRLDKFFLWYVLREGSLAARDTATEKLAQQAVETVLEAVHQAGGETFIRSGMAQRLAIVSITHNYSVVRDALPNFRSAARMAESVAHPYMGADSTPDIDTVSMGITHRQLAGIMEDIGPSFSNLHVTEFKVPETGGIKIFKVEVMDAEGRPAACISFQASDNLNLDRRSVGQSKHMGFTVPLYRYGADNWLALIDRKKAADLLDSPDEYFPDKDEPINRVMVVLTRSLLWAALKRFSFGYRHEGHSREWDSVDYAMTPESIQAIADYGKIRGTDDISASVVPEVELNLRLLAGLDFGYITLLRKLGFEKQLGTLDESSYCNNVCYSGLANNLGEGHSANFILYLLGETHRD